MDNRPVFLLIWLKYTPPPEKNFIKKNRRFLMFFVFFSVHIIFIPIVLLVAALWLRKKSFTLMSNYLVNVQLSFIQWNTPGTISTQGMVWSVNATRVSHPVCFYCIQPVNRLFSLCHKDGLFSVSSYTGFTGSSCFFTSACLISSCWQSTVASPSAATFFS